MAQMTEKQRIKQTRAAITKFFTKYDFIFDQEYFQHEDVAKCDEFELLSSVSYDVSRLVAGAFSDIQHMSDRDQISGVADSMKKMMADYDDLLAEAHGLPSIHFGFRGSKA